MEEQVSTVLEPFLPARSPDELLSLLKNLRNVLYDTVREYGSIRVCKFSDHYIRSQIRSTSLSSLLISYIEKYPDELGDICEECLTLLTPDTVACGASRGKRAVVDIVPRKVSFDIALGDFYDDWTGCRVWPGAYILSQHILCGRFNVSDCEVLELGSGLGIGGITAMHAGAHKVTFTEHNANQLELCMENARNNLASPKMRFSGFLLDWELFGCSVDLNFLKWNETRDISKEFVVIGSEVVFEFEHTDMIIQVLSELFRSGASRALICVMIKPERRGVSSYLARLNSLSADYPFGVEQISEIQKSPTEVGACIHLYSRGKI
jgi:predicted nicotinamide N-methyase